MHKGHKSQGATEGHLNELEPRWLQKWKRDGGDDDDNDDDDGAEDDDDDNDG